MLALVLCACALNLILSVLGKNYTYKILKIDKDFDRNLGGNQWYTVAYPHSNNRILNSYTIIRTDERTSKWKFMADSDINVEVRKIYWNDKIRSPVFNAHQFLSMMRNKQLGMLGDSNCLQMFDGLQNLLSPYVTNSYDHNGSKTKLGGKTIAISIASYNTTIFFCWDVHLQIARDNPCLKRFYGPSTDILIFGVAAWFKPKHMHSGPEVSYHQSYNWSQIDFRKALKKARAHVIDINPNVKVIWKLQAHVGKIDELHFLHNISMDHKAGLYWSNTSLCAHWVPVYNDIITQEAAVYDDPVMDWFTLSNQYIEYVSHGMAIPVHVDSIHYYADGVPRAGALLIQDALYDILN